jgi:uncharacterized protein YyaL (SSP411 family)
LHAAEDTIEDRAAWLTLFAQIGTLSSDERIAETTAAIVATLERDWSSAWRVDEAVCAIEGCLTADAACVPPELVAAAIDGLERIVGQAYRPGEGIGHAIDEPGGERGRLSDHVRAASALLAGYARSGRLPYSMLAEELMQFAHHVLWDDAAGGFFECIARAGGAAGDQNRVKPFVLNCEAARVLCRLEALHRDAAYREVAVLADRAAYVRDAAHTLSSQTSNLRQRGPGAAIYGIAFLELQSAI